MALQLRAPFRTIEHNSSDSGDVSFYQSSDAVSISVEAVDYPKLGFFVKSGLTVRDRGSYSSNSYYLEFGGISLEEPQKAYDTLQDMLAKACIKLGSGRGSGFSVSEFVKQEERSYGFEEPSFLQGSVPPLKESLRQRETRSWYRRILG